MKRSAIRHQKTIMLSRELNIPIPHALGILTMLWDYASEYTPQGDIGRIKNEVIAISVCWPEDRCDQLIDALIATGWLDRDKTHRLLIHDFHDHAEQWVKKRLTRDRKTFLTLQMHENNGIAQNVDKWISQDIQNGPAGYPVDVFLDPLDILLEKNRKPCPTSPAQPSLAQPSQAKPSPSLAAAGGGWPDGRGTHADDGRIGGDTDDDGQGSTETPLEPPANAFDLKKRSDVPPEDKTQQNATEDDLRGSQNSANPMLRKNNILENVLRENNIKSDEVICELSDIPGITVDRVRGVFDRVGKKSNVRDPVSLAVKMIRDQDWGSSSGADDVYCLSTDKCRPLKKDDPILRETTERIRKKRGIS